MRDKNTLRREYQPPGKVQGKAVSKAHETTHPTSALPAKMLFAKQGAHLGVSLGRIVANAGGQTIRQPKDEDEGTFAS